MDPDEHAKRLAAAAADDDPAGWFETLYAGSREPGGTPPPWDRGAPHVALVTWATERGLRGEGRPALVVGAGTGDDAEYLCTLGFDTLAFDAAPTAAAIMRERYPGTRVRYETADLLRLPERWRGAFDLVFECMTVQSLPIAYHADATAAVTSTVAPGGTLLVVASGRPDDLDPDGPPWPLTRAEIDAFAAPGGAGLEATRVETQEAVSGPPYFRWVAELRRPGAG